ncbi:UDP-N-acetylglucosamine 2-epimerase, partial [uncultured Lentibacter sp.]|uniref:UDP-N-acetylglucosamine 2-epimerase n=1 Tax=uncultured Lentibacter sp. TaxID=1659309 RepID=UPI0034560A2A
QEEAPTFRVPVVVTRKETERTEGLDGYGIYCIPPQATHIYSTAAELLDGRRCAMGLSGGAKTL